MLYPLKKSKSNFQSLYLLEELETGNECNLCTEMTFLLNENHCPECLQVQMRADQALVLRDAADSADTVLKSMYVKQEMADCDLCSCGFQSPLLHADED